MSATDSGADFDLSMRVMANLDKHMQIPILEFLEEKKFYKAADLIKANLQICETTKMVDSIEEQLKKLSGKDTLSPEKTKEMEAIRADVYKSLGDAKAACQPLSDLLDEGKGERAKAILNENNMRMEYLETHYKVTDANVASLYNFAKLSFDCGRYRDAADMLFYYRLLTRDDDKSFWALWGKLAAEILLKDLDIALEDLERLRELIDRRKADEVTQLQQRAWLAHWALFVCFGVEAGAVGRGALIDFFFQDKILNAIQMTSPHLLRYLTAAGILHRKKRNALKDIVRILGSEKASYSDPLTEFLRALYVDFDFDAAHAAFKQCKLLIAHDFFLAPLAAELLDSARTLLFETYCRIHKCIDIALLAEKLDFKKEEALPRIVELVRTTRVDAKLDTERNQLIMDKQYPTAYQQVIDKTKGIAYRSSQLAQLIDSKYQDDRERDRDGRDRERERDDRRDRDRDDR